MPDVLITEFMDAAAVAALSADFTVDSAPGLVDAQDEIPERLWGARALMVGLFVLLAFLVHLAWKRKRRLGIETHSLKKAEELAER